MKDTGLSASYSYSIVSCMMYGIETGNMNNLMLRDVVVHHTAPLCFSRWTSWWVGDVIWEASPATCCVPMPTCPFATPLGS